jgi:hypothetical protein
MGCGFLRNEANFVPRGVGGGGLWGLADHEKQWSAMRFKSPVFADAPTWLQGSRRLGQGIPGKQLILKEKKIEIEVADLANYRSVSEKNPSVTFSLSPFPCLRFTIRLPTP